jgi:hypothetical protein
MATGVTYYGRISTNIISHYFLNEVWEATTNNRPFFMALKKRGHIESGLTGQNVTWNINAGRHTMAAYDDAEVINITRKKHEIQAVLPWAFLTVTDAITRDEIAMSGSETNFRRVNKDMLERMKSNFQTRLNAQALTQDGNAVGTNVLHGVETFMAATGTLATRQTANDTYAGIVTVTGGITTIDNPEPNAWSPTLTNYTSTGWAVTGATWRLNARESLTTTKDLLTFGNEKEKQPDLVILDRTMFSTLKDVLSATQHLYVSQKPEDSPTGLGIPGAIEYDGMEVIFDTDQTANTGFVGNFHQTFLDVLQVPEVPGQSKIPGGGGASSDNMFECNVKDDITTNGILCRVNFRAQLRFNPRAWGKLFNYG